LKTMTYLNGAREKKNKPPGQRLKKE